MTRENSPILRFRWIIAAAGVVCLAGSLLGLARNQQQFFFSYLWSWLFWMGLSTGSFLIAMIHQLTGGRWGFPTRRIYEAAFMGLPLMLFLFVPLLFGLRELYPWARPDEVLREHVLQHRGAYLAFWPYTARAILVLLVLSALAIRLRHFSLQQDATPDANPTRSARRLSGLGLVIAGLLVTFASVDWIMSLETRWFSSIFALVLMAGQVLLAFAFSILMLALLRHVPPLSQVLGQTHFHQLGTLLFTFVLFWAYVSFGQLLIIYSGDLPPEVDWYLHRISGHWKYVVVALAIFHFFIPFFLLLFRVLKTNVAPLATIAALVFLSHGVEAFWLVTPSLNQHGPAVSWLDVLLPMGMGALWFSFFLGRLQGAPLLPQQDPGMQFAFIYGK